MDNIVDITFNFELFSDLIAEALNEFNIAKEKYCSGEETEKYLIQKADLLMALFESCDILIDRRISLIEDKYIDDSYHNRDKMLEERSYLVKLHTWHQKMKETVKKEKDLIISGEFGVSNEPEF